MKLSTRDTKTLNKRHRKWRRLSTKNIASILMGLQLMASLLILFFSSPFPLKQGHYSGAFFFPQKRFAHDARLKPQPEHSPFFNTTPSFSIFELQKAFFDRNSSSSCWHSWSNQCDTPHSLRSFLDSLPADAPQYWRNQPVCHDAAYHRMHIIVPFFNVSTNLLVQSVASVLLQSYPRITLWLYDDGSPDITPLETICTGCRSSITMFEPLQHQEMLNVSWSANEKLNRNHAKEFVRSSYYHQQLSAGHKQMNCVRSVNHLGAGGGKYWLMRLAHSLAEPNDVVVVLDGDDNLMSPSALQVINQAYLNKNAWFTYGSYRGKWEKQVLPIPMEIQEGKVAFQPRHQVWRWGHPRTFKAHLLDYITLQDYTYAPSNSWLLKGTDCAFIYRMLELSGTDRIVYIPTKISNSTSTIAAINGETREKHIWFMSTLPPSSQLILPLHVVILCWKRVALLYNQLEWLDDQEDLGKRKIHIHIVNNNKEQREDVDKIAQRFVGHNPHMKDRLTVRHGAEVDGENLQNFARFKYVQELRQTLPIDQVVFLDDDQYWNPKFLFALTSSYLPKGYTTWYGKVFKMRHAIKIPCDKNHSFAHYWKPYIEYSDLVKAKKWPEVTHFKYGGTGGSIWDTNLWLAENQLMRLANISDLFKWRKVDDLWASYVVDALLGWDIRRLAPFVITAAVDIGSSSMKPQDALVANKHKETYDHLVMQHRNSTRKVATFDNVNVNKTDMFITLQKDFWWDAFSIHTEDYTLYLSALQGKVIITM